MTATDLDEGPSDDPERDFVTDDLEVLWSGGGSVILARHFEDDSGPDLYSLTGREEMEAVGERLQEIADELCEVCGDRQHETLSSDSHPEGVNLLICEECVV